MIDREKLEETLTTRLRGAEKELRGSPNADWASYLRGVSDAMWTVRDLLRQGEFDA